MAVLTDTNILLRLQQPHHPHCQIAQHSLNILRARNETLVITSQNLIEFWVVATHPSDENGLGLTIDQAIDEVDQLNASGRCGPMFPSLTNGNGLSESIASPARMPTTLA